jgi:hypothetical protein
MMKKTGKSLNGWKWNFNLADKIDKKFSGSLRRWIMNQRKGLAQKSRFCVSNKCRYNIE